MSDSHPLAEYRAAQQPPLTQDDLGSRIGVDGMTVSRWERGESLPQKRQWPKIESVTGIPREKLISVYAQSEPAQ